MEEFEEIKEYKDTRTKEAVGAENKKILKAIIHYCRRGDYRKHNVLMIGMAGSGKSSVINTVLKVIIGDFIPRAKSGSGNVPSKTLLLGRYLKCASKMEDFPPEIIEKEETVDSLPEELFKTVWKQLPDLFDAAAMGNKNDEKTKEIVRLLIGGYIDPGTDIAELEKMQTNKGLGYLSLIYCEPYDQYKMSMIVFACSCVSPIPYELIKCVREVLQEVDPNSLHKRYDSDVYLLITKYDRVVRDNFQDKRTDGGIGSAAGDSSIEVIASTEDKPSAEDDGGIGSAAGDSSIEVIASTEDKPSDEVDGGIGSADGDSYIEMIANTEALKINPALKINGDKEETITFNQYKTLEKQLAEAFVIKGSISKCSLPWVSYNDAVGDNNPYIDNNSLKLLKYLTTPFHTEAGPRPVPKPGPGPWTLWFRKVKADMLFSLQKLNGQHVLLIVGICVVFLAMIVLMMSGTLRKFALPESAQSASAQSESNHPESASPEYVPPESAPPESAPTESSSPRSAPPESAPSESAPPESAPPESAPPESAPSESAPP